MPTDQILDTPAGLLRHPVHRREVELADATLRKLLGEQSVRAIMLGHDHAAARFLIEPMHNARPQLTADAAKIIAMMEQCIDQRAIRIPCRRMHDQARRFVDHNKMLILIEHGQRNVLRHDLRAHRLRNGDLNLIAHLHLCAGLQDLAIHSDAPLLDQVLQT